MDTVQTDFPLHLYHGCGCILLMCDSPAAPVFISHYGIGVKILITGMPSEVPVLLQGLISLACGRPLLGLIDSEGNLPQWGPLGSRGKGQQQPVCRSGEEAVNEDVTKSMTRDDSILRLVS